MSPQQPHPSADENGTVGRRRRISILAVAGVIAVAGALWSGSPEDATAQQAAVAVTGPGPAAVSATAEPGNEAGDAPASPAGPEATLRATSEPTVPRVPSDHGVSGKPPGSDTKPSGSDTEPHTDSGRVDAAEAGTPEAAVPGEPYAEEPRADEPRVDRPGTTKEQTLDSAGSEPTPAVGESVTAPGSEAGGDRSAGLEPRGPVDPAEVKSGSDATLGGCLVEYGANGQCLPVIPPSAADHAQQMRASGLDPLQMAHPWDCSEVREMFSAGLDVRQEGVDPQKLDTNGDGTACGPGD